MADQPSTSSSSQKVTLNVGGVRFTTTVQTLQKEPDSMLARLVSDDWRRRGGSNIDRATDQENEIFIDRNGRHFHLILDYLRHGPLGAYIPDNVDTLNELLRESEFYQLATLTDKIKDKLHAPGRLISRGDAVRWREDAVEYYWRPFAVAIATEGIEYAFLFDKVGRKYNDKQTVAMCIGCCQRFLVDQVTVFDYKVHFEEWEALKHHMMFMRGVVSETINDTCCVVQWNNGKHLHVPFTAVVPAE